MPGHGKFPADGDHASIVRQADGRFISASNIAPASALITCWHAHSEVV